MDGLVILELKAAEDIIKAHELQLVNYLKATSLEVGFKQKIFTNNRKPALKRMGR